ncbi:MAG: hypothetical protein U1F43_25880 [Myxococcota bacterium]
MPGHGPDAAATGGLASASQAAAARIRDGVGARKKGGSGGGDDASGGAQKPERLEHFADPSVLVNLPLPGYNMTRVDESTIDLDAAVRLFAEGRGQVLLSGVLSGGVKPLVNDETEVHLPMGFRGTVQVGAAGTYMIDELKNENGSIRVYRGMNVQVKPDGTIEWLGEARSWISPTSFPSFTLSSSISNQGDEVVMKLALDATAHPEPLSVSLGPVSVPVQIQPRVGGHYERYFRVKVIVDGKPPQPVPPPTTPAAPPVAAAAASAAASASASASAHVTVNVTPPPADPPTPLPPPQTIHFPRGRSTATDAQQLVTWALALRARYPRVFDSLVGANPTMFIDLEARASHPGPTALNGRLSAQRGAHVRGLLQQWVGPGVRINVGAFGELAAAPVTDEHYDARRDEPEQIVIVKVFGEPRPRSH